MDLRRIQDLAWENKVDKGFYTSDVAEEFGLLELEVSEAFSAWRKGRPPGRWWQRLLRLRPRVRLGGSALRAVASELADVLIFLVSLAAMLGIDLQAAVEAKLAENKGRVYRELPNGTHVKVPAGQP